MKKILITSIFLLIMAYFTPVYSFENSDLQNLSKIENNIFGFEYNAESLDSRLSRLEKTIYGKSSSGDINSRLKKISNDISADVIGLEIEPKKDTFAEDNDLVADSSVSYPVVDEIEEKLFNTTYKNRDLHTRIVTIEKKLFHKVYDVDDYSTRMDRIKAEIMPETIVNADKFQNEYRDNRISTEDISGTSLNRFGMPFGQRNYTRPYSNYGGGYSTGKASPYSNFNTNPNLNDELSQMEIETFGTEFSNEDSTSRIKRLNSVNKAQKSSSKYDSQKFSQRMSTAMEIGAMILMILAMVL